MTETAIGREIKRLEKQMLEHARNLEFEQAARVRDQLADVRRKVFGVDAEEPAVVPAPKEATR
jgi:excinuclease ABC subunit B